MSEDLLAGVYRHYTGLIVLVLGTARHSETEEKFVVYVPLGPKKGPRLTIRPFKMFFEEVEIKGQKQPRFSYAGAEMPEKLAGEYYFTHGWGYPGKK